MEIITKPKAGVYFVALDDKKGCHNVAALQSFVRNKCAVRHKVKM